MRTRYGPRTHLEQLYKVAVAHRAARVLRGWARRGLDRLTHVALQPVPLPRLRHVDCLSSIAKKNFLCCARAASIRHTVNPETTAWAARIKSKLCSLASLVAQWQFMQLASRLGKDLLVEPRVTSTSARPDKHSTAVSDTFTG